MTDLTALQNQIKEVAKGRAQLRGLKETKEHLYEQWTQENATLISDIKFLDNCQIEAENYLRALTLEVYRETGEKKPCEGVAIREVTRLDYDPKEALKWAMSHQIALSLDKKSFEGFAKATPLEFVTINIELQATISTDLSPVLSPVNP